MGHGHSDITRLLDDPGHARAVAENMQALATPSRLRIMARLHGGEASVSELADAVGMTASAVSQQLRVLRHLGLVVGERTGRQVVYTLHDDHVGELLTQAVAHVEHVRLGLAAQHRSAREAVA
ncbi:metalloregulator ArsR/SmtB family transcription factor [Paraconexibacter antarcticus]|uniref:Metalloregulator ArsR/SmtB family transcription factor n=1 Tax=Paraconexibacter antarcticus TaxID=2949664 RepID=A0ABY5DUC3_9ACTN|nr:metalloregulator ArsR/SmtB family transcription factor [Paraconexibacter antarcticus]UTI64302.1 metalloregulator ArsR/SmtB family transcription factor [Paraconexibacter antarcticus]